MFVSPGPFLGRKILRTLGQFAGIFGFGGLLARSCAPLGGLHLPVVDRIVLTRGARCGRGWGVSRAHEVVRRLQAGPCTRSRCRGSAIGRGSGSGFIVQDHGPTGMLLGFQSDEVCPGLFLELTLVSGFLVLRRDRATGKENGESERAKLLHRRTLCSFRGELQGGNGCM